MTATAASSPGFGDDFVEDFDGASLDPTRWLPNYLPAWSSRAATAADLEVSDSALRLRIRPGHPLWLPDDHPTPLRVSGIQSGNFSGEVGTTRGQQTYAEGALVRERQDELRGWLPTGGRLEMRARAVVSPRSMVAWWLVGFEDAPERSAEICVFEIFGDAVDPGRSAEVGMGLHPFRDPDVVDDFAAPRLGIDVAGFHDYAVDWSRDRVEFSVDGTLVRGCDRPPWYPMQSMIAVFDFPDRSSGDDAHLVPELVVDRVRGSGSTI